MSANPLDRLPLFILHIAEFAELFEFIPFRVVVPRPKLVVSPVRRRALSPQPQHEPHVVAEWNDPMKDLIVADEPRRDHRQERNGSHDINRKPGLAATMSTIDDPSG
ncbi:MAG: hypothetical protein ACLPN2_11950 [Terriglobales bacterium]